MADIDCGVPGLLYHAALYRFKGGCVNKIPSTLVDSGAQWISVAPRTKGQPAKTCDGTICITILLTNLCCRLDRTSSIAHSHHSSPSNFQCASSTLVSILAEIELCNF